MTEDRSNEEVSSDTARRPETMTPRFDSAHAKLPAALSEAAEPAADLVRAVAGKSNVASEQLQLQAAELAEHLRERQHGLARREATLNARSAEYDAQQRSARLWIRERQKELDDAAADFQQQHQQLELQAAHHDAAKQTAELCQLAQQQTQQVQQDLDEQREQLDRELETVRNQASWLESARTGWQQQCRDERRTLDQLREQLLDQRQATEQLNLRLREQLTELQNESRQSDDVAQQQRDMDVEQAHLRDLRAELEAERQALLCERELWQSRTLQQRQAIAALGHRRRERLQHQQQRLQDRQEAVDQQEETQRQHLQELDRQRRQVVEQQLVAQHALATLGRQVPPRDLAKVEQAVSQYVQSQLAAAEETLADSRVQLQTAAASLRQQQETLKIRHARLHAQIALRQRDLDTQTTQLERREQEICQREGQSLQASVKAC